MPTKKQHFVPRVYMKAWETQVETIKEPDKKFNGIYVIKDGSIGDGANRNSVLWKPHLYTINFKYSFICNSCAKVKSQYVDLIYDLLKTGFKQPVYGKLGYSIIKTKKSINKHFFEIHDWDFYYYDGNVAKKAAILSQIDALNCYILEDSFDDYLEKNWENIMNSFVGGVHNGQQLDLKEVKESYLKTSQGICWRRFSLCFVEIQNLTLWVFIQKLKRNYCILFLSQCVKLRKQKH